MANRLASNSPVFGQTLRGTRGSQMQNQPRSPTPGANSQPQHYYRPIQSPLTVAYSGPRPYRAPSFSPVPMQQQMHSGSQPDYMYNRMSDLQPPSPAFELAPRYEYVGVPLEPPLNSHSYVIYDGEDENTLSTAEIIERQSQDYVDEQLAQFEQNTIAKLQGK